MTNNQSNLQHGQFRPFGLSFETRHSLAIWWSALWRGLRAAPGTGAYKAARLALLRLWSPFSAVAVPCLVLWLLLVLPWMRRAEPPPPSNPVTLREEETEPSPLPKPRPRRLDPPRLDEQWRQPDPTVARFPDPLPAAAPEPMPAVRPTLDPLRGVSRIVSRVTFQSVWSGRTGPGRAAALEQGGGLPGGEDAVIAALRWLKYEQQSDGSWLAPPPAMTGLALLAFLAHGERPDSPEFGDTVRKALQWLVENQEASGRFKGRDQHDYSHPIATYALCEGYGLTRIPQVRAAAERAARVIVAGQNPGGGWNYNCRPSERNDTSYMGWCLQALKAASIARLDVEGLQTALARAKQGFLLNAHPDGGFGYTSPGRGPLTGLGVLALQLLHAADTPAAVQGLAFLREATIDWRAPMGERPIYYWYYITQAKFHAGGRDWEQWNDVFAPELVRTQQTAPSPPDETGRLGYWTAPTATERPIGNVYSTALCTLMLEVYYRYLYIYDFQAHERAETDDSAPVAIRVRLPGEAG